MKHILKYIFSLIFVLLFSNNGVAQEKDTLKAKELFNEALLLSKQLNNGKEILKTLK